MLIKKKVDLEVNIIEVYKNGEVRAVGISSAVLKIVGPRGVWVRVPPSPQKFTHAANSGDNHRKNAVNVN